MSVAESPRRGSIQDCLPKRLAFEVIENYLLDVAGTIRWLTVNEQQRPARGIPTSAADALNYPGRPAASASRASQGTPPW